MKLTRFERQFVNSTTNAERVARVAIPLLEQVALPPKPRCLELGCGQGVVTRLLVERHSAQVTASDYDPEQVALAQGRLADLDGQVEFRIVDARAMPFDDAQFDAIAAFQVMHHIPGGWREMVAEAARVLKPGGCFIFTDMVLTSRLGWLVRCLPSWLDQLEESALHACLAENGLRLEHYARGRGVLSALLGHCAAIARSI
jgi:ubiquinone/menaquinone biosynthesis C-methylase UbiE